MAKVKAPKYVSPRSVFKFPWLSKADTKFKAEGEYKITQVFTEAKFTAPMKATKSNPDGLSLMALLDNLTDASFKVAYDAAKTPGEKKKINKVLPYKEQEDEEGNHNGNYEVHYKLMAKVTPKDTTKDPFTQKPVVVDAAGKELEAAVYGGSEGKVSFETRDYFMPKDKDAGISLRLKGVQVLKLVTSGGATAASLGFDDESEGESDEDAVATTATDTGDDGDF
jgi:hypothetical protein